MAIFKLVEEGHLSLDAHPGEYLSCAEGLDHRITLRMLLAHASGLGKITTSEVMAYRGAIDLHALVSALASRPLDFVPGHGTYYRNTSFLIPTLIAEAVTGEKMGLYLEKQIFAPLGMNDAYSETRCSPNDSRRAKGYEKLNGMICPAQ